MSTDEMSAQARAARAQQQAEEARRAAAAHAAQRREAYAAARRQPPGRRPPGVDGRAAPPAPRRPGASSPAPVAAPAKEQPTDPAAASTAIEATAAPAPAPAPVRPEPATPPAATPPRTARPAAPARPAAATPPVVRPTSTLAGGDGAALAEVAEDAAQVAESTIADVPVADVPVADVPVADLPAATADTIADPVADPSAAAGAGMADGTREGHLTGLPTTIPPLPLPPGATGPAPRPRIVSADAPAATPEDPAVEEAVTEVAAVEEAAADPEPAATAAAPSATIEIRPQDLLASADAAVASTEGLQLPDPPRPAPDAEATTPAEADDDPPLQAAATAGTPSLDAADPDQHDGASTDPAPAGPEDEDPDGEDITLVTPAPSDTAAPSAVASPSAASVSLPLGGHADGLVLPGPPRHADGLSLPTPPWTAADLGQDDEAVAEDAPAAAPVVADVAESMEEASGDDSLDATVDLSADPAASVDPAAPADGAPGGDAAPAEPAPAESVGEPAPEDVEPDGPVGSPDQPTAAAAVAAAPVTPPAAGERPWTRLYPPGVPETYRYPLVPLSRLLDDAAQDFPDATAVSFLGTQTTYGDLAEQVDRLAAALVDRGLHQGDRVGIALPWSPQLVVSLCACWRAGLVAVIHDPELVGEALLGQMEATGPRALIVLDSLYPVISGARGRLDTVEHVIASGLLDALPPLRARVLAMRMRIPGFAIPLEDGVAMLGEVIAATPPSRRTADVEVERAPAAVIFDRGEPVVLTHLNMVTAAFQARLWVPDVQAGKEGVVVAGEVGNAFTLTAGLVAAILSASTVHLPPPGADGAARAVDDMRPTLLVGTDAALAAVLAPASRRRDLSSVRVTLSDRPASEPAMGPAMQSRTAGRFRTAISGQALGGMVAAQPVYGDARAEIQGLPVTDTEMAVADPGAGGVGRLLACGPQVPGPARAEEHTAELP